MYRSFLSPLLLWGTSLQVPHEESVKVVRESLV